MTTYWNLSSTFVGFTEVQPDNQTVSLSTTTDTVVDIEIDGPPTGNNADLLTPQTLAISGGFRVCDPGTGNVTNVGAHVAQSTTDPTHPSSWFIRLVFPPQASATTVLIKAWGIFAVFACGTQ